MTMHPIRSVLTHEGVTIWASWCTRQRFPVQPPTFTYDVPLMNMHGGSFGALLAAAGRPTRGRVEEL